MLIAPAAQGDPRAAIDEQAAAVRGMWRRPATKVLLR
jgi:hypothetical protein